MDKKLNVNNNTIVRNSQYFIIVTKIPRTEEHHSSGSLISLKACRVFTYQLQNTGVARV